MQRDHLEQEVLLVLRRYLVDNTRLNLSLEQQSDNLFLVNINALTSDT